MSFSCCKIIIGYSLYLSLIILSISCGVKKKTILKGENSSRKELVTKTNLSQYYADVLGVPQKSLNMKLYEQVDKWMNVPHKLGGMNTSGVDCSGFVSLIYEEVYGKNLPRISRDMASIVKRKYESQLKEGDLVFFSFSGRGIDHVGIYLHNGKFVHVSTKSGVVISNLRDVWYYKYFVRCGTPKL